MRLCGSKLGDNSFCLKLSHADLNKKEYSALNVLIKVIIMNCIK